MARESEFSRYVADILSPMGHVTCRAMFGGFGVYCTGVMFGLIAYDTLYLKADGSLEQRFIDEGQGPFVYEGNGKSVQMSYWRLPERLYEDEDELIAWARDSLDLAMRLKKAKPEKAGRKRKDAP